MFNWLQNQLSKILGNPQVFSTFWKHDTPKKNLTSFLNAYSGWVYAAVSAIAQDVASIELSLHSVKKGTKLDVTDRGLLPMDVLKKVNDFMTFYDLVEIHQTYLDLVGRSYWYTPLVNNMPAEIYPLVPSRVKVARDNTNIIAGYVYLNEEGKEIPLSADEVVYFRQLDPLNPYTGGYSPTFAAAIAIDTWEHSSNYNKNFFSNSGIPEGVLETEQSLTKEQLNDLRQKWNAQHSGTSNAKKVAILQKGLTYKPVQTSPRDMDFAMLKQDVRDEILAMYRVPRTVVGITDDVNRANAETTDYVFSKRVINPRMKKFVNGLNEFWLPRFKMAGTYEFSYDDPTPQDLTAIYAQNQTGIQSGFITQNEAREQIGLEPVKGGDDLYLPFNLAPANSAGGKNDKKKTVFKITKSKPETKYVFDISPEKIKKTVDARSEFVENATKERANELKVFFNNQSSWIQAQLRKLSKGAEKEILDELVDHPDWQKFLKELVDPTTEYALRLLMRGGSDAIGFVSDDAYVVDEEAKAWVRKFVAKEITNVDDFTKEVIRHEVLFHVDEGTSINDLKKRLKDTFKKFEDYRAERIARTESAAAYGQGTIQGYKQSNIVKRIRSISAGDSKVSDICLANERQGAVLLGSNFESGHQHPPFHVNCRCTVIPVSD